MQVVAVCVGKIAPLWGGSENDQPSGKVLSAIVKTPVSVVDDPQPVAVGLLGLDGDEQADLSVHGGRDKAVYAYPVEHYPVWRTLRMQALKIDEALPLGSMGENLTLSGLTEDRVWIGDVVTIGSALESAVVMRVAAPRSPCFKFNHRMGFKHASKMMVQSGYTGFYLQVMRPGLVKAGDRVSITPGARLMRVDEQHRFNTTSGQGILL
jgi:MOSC domain-containing protein YiiM